MIRAVVFDVGETLVDESREYGSWADWLGVPRHTFSSVFGAVIAEGAASGEFEIHDVPQAAMCTCTAMMRFFHPQMIAQCADKPGPTIDQMIDFVLAGLAPRAKGAGRTT